MSDDNRFEKQLYSMTTLIIAECVKSGMRYSSQGSGFFYNEMTPVDPTKSGAQWHKLERHWLVTNRHVALPKIDGVECVPDQFLLCLRKIVNDSIEWMPIVLSKDQLLTKLKLHENVEVDVALIDITDEIKKVISEIAAKGTNDILLPTMLSNQNLPQNQPITIDVTSDIIVASYPKGFYDAENKFPIVKSGIVASAWGLNFRGLPMFQIDAQLFPGSSGGLVISKPTNLAFINGELKYNTTKQFVLLGVYSGEYKWHEEIEIAETKYKMGNSYGLGNVWYSNLIPQIIDTGISYTI